MSQKYGYKKRGVCNTLLSIYRKKRIGPTALKYRAKQVLLREDADGPFIPLGTHFIAKLETAIDTRNKGHWVKAVLPYGTKFKDKARLPKSTLLIGQASYAGRGNKVLVRFSKGILPNGREFGLQAQALNLKTQGPGIKGTYHSGTAGRVAGVLGLSMVQGMTEALTQKEALGEYGVVAPKATMENAFYHGLSKVTEMEAQRRAQELQGAGPYVTIQSGKAFIVGLTATLKGGFLNHEE